MVELYDKIIFVEDLMTMIGFMIMEAFFNAKMMRNQVTTLSDTLPKDPKSSPLLNEDGKSQLKAESVMTARNNT